ncbi:malonate--CoA ligase-like [Camellia sinensis]|uniref:malonate--CoA ligase-like n=1 Tax=Camellia sinensis TaxID=4442 RepID=UPI001036B3F8|nr:malonate--CoA ligase-like [Camellia sinensis]
MDLKALHAASYCPKRDSYSSLRFKAISISKLHRLHRLDFSDSISSDSVISILISKPHRHHHLHRHAICTSEVEFIPKFSVRAIWQRWRESYPKDGTKADDAIIVFTGVPTMYTRLIQGYEAMDPELQEVSASAASKLRLMQSLRFKS